MIFPSFRTVAWWAAIAFTIWWVVTQPAQADQAVHHVSGLLGQAAHGLSQFVSNL